MRIGELAARSGVSVRALRYYEEQGLLRPERTTSGQRRYDESAVELVRFFQDMFAAGLSSRTIAVLLPCVHSKRPSSEQRAAVLTERERIAETLARLQSSLVRLDELIELGEQLAS